MPPGPGVDGGNLHGDVDSDQDDFGIVQLCYSGAGVPTDPACAP
jgi:hypothetical protein